MVKLIRPKGWTSAAPQYNSVQYKESLWDTKSWNKTQRDTKSWNETQRDTKRQQLNEEERKHGGSHFNNNRLIL